MMIWDYPEEREERKKGVYYCSDCGSPFGDGEISFFDGADLLCENCYENSYSGEMEWEESTEEYAERVGHEVSWVRY